MAIIALEFLGLPGEIVKSLQKETVVPHEYLVGNCIVSELFENYCFFKVILFQFRTTHERCYK